MVRPSRCSKAIAGITVPLRAYVRPLARNGVKLVSITKEWATIPCMS
jgi:hypothetical protein